MAFNSVAEMKPMRKGTCSCRECRRRKIKCIWPSASSTTCTECAKHRRECLSQGYVVNSSRIAKSRTVVEVKVDRIPSIVERLAKHQEDCYDKKTRQDQWTSDEIQSHLQDLDVVDEQSARSSPLYALFNNDIFKEPDGRQAPHLITSTSLSFGDNQLSDLAKLQSTVAQDPNILDVLDVSSDWWYSWRDQSWVLREEDTPQSLRSFVQSKLESNDPVEYAIGLMCIALALQQIRPGKDDTNLVLSAHPVALMECIVTAVDQIILTSYLQNVTVILVALQRAKIHAESNQLRKSWLRIRHALILAKGFEYTNDPKIAQEEILERQRWIGGIYEMDNLMSMILGFPHATNSQFTDKLALAVLQQGRGDILLKMRALRRVIALTAARINDRNAGISINGIEATSNIQKTLNLAASAMPPDWWYAEAHGFGPEPHVAFEHLMVQLWFWQIQSFLHLPVMLNAGRNESRDSSLLCLQGCRNVLEVFCRLRGDPALSLYICNCEDFQAILTACILLVGILSQISSNTAPDHFNFEAEYALLEDVKDIFRYRSQQQGGSIAKQGLKAIETLESFMIGDPEDRQQPLRKAIVLPYFGLINVERRDVAKTSPPMESIADDVTATLATRNSAALLVSHPQVQVQEQTPNFDFSSTGTFNTDWSSADVSIDWNQFLHGEELAQNWEIFNDVFC